MSSSNYKDWQSTQLTPAWLQQPYGLAWNRAFGAMKDALVDRLKQALKARMPLICPPDALQALALERGLFRGINEGTTPFATRVANAWNAWPWAGTPYGVLNQLYLAGYQNVALLSGKRWYTVDATGNLVVTAIGGWMTNYPNANLHFWNTFSVIVGHPWPAAWTNGFPNGVWTTHVGTGPAGGVNWSQLAGAGDYQFAVKIIVGGAVGTATFQWSQDNGVTWSSTTTTSGSYITLGTTGWRIYFSGTQVAGDYYYACAVPPNDSSADANLFRAVISNWKPAHAICTAIILPVTGKLIGYPPTRTLGASNGVIGGAYAVNWTPPAN